MASSGTINNTFRTGYAIKIVWDETSQDIANNSTIITVKVQLVSLGSSYIINSSASKSGSVTINGTKYNFSFTAALSGNQTKTLYTKPVSIKHNADGSKTASLSCVVGLDVTLSGTYWGDVTASGSAVLNTIPRASTIASVTSSVAINGTNTCAVSITRASSAFKHTVVWKFGSYSKTTTDVDTSTSYAIPLTWINAMPSSISGTATVTVTTYNGSSKIGNAVSKSFTVTVPSTIVPSISNLALSEGVSDIADKFQGYVQNKSKLAVSVSASGVYSSTIKAYKTTILGNNYFSASFTSGVLKSSGTVEVKTTVTDSRGRTATLTKNISVMAYSPPSIGNFEVFRADSTGKQQEEGTSAGIRLKFNIASLNSKNSATYVIEYKLPTASVWTNLESGSAYTFDGLKVKPDIFAVDNSYNVRLKITDSFATVSATTEVSSAFTLLDFKADGTGVAFGKVAEHSDTVEFALAMRSTRGHLITSPKALEVNQNLNDLLDVGYYIVGNTAVSSTILNKPPRTNTETAFIEVMAHGDGLQKIQRFTVCDKDDQYIWQRLYYTGTWGDWMMVAGCSGWKSLTISNGFEAYSSNTTPKYRVNGQLVTIEGAVKPTTAFTSSTTKVVMVSGIPEAIRPDTPLTFVSQGSGMNRWACGVETDGTLTISRYGITEGATVAVGAWLIFNCTYSL